MNVIGRRLSVLSSTDPTKVGIAGTAVLETANMVVILAAQKKLMIEKRGNTFQLGETGNVITGSELAGRLEDRWGRRT